MQITEITKKSIIDELRLREIVWNGNISEIEFLNRIYLLEILPSGDPRFKNMEGDIYQHRVNNYDWEDDYWVFSDDRLKLAENDESFLSFITETIHPVVRNEKDVSEMVELYNKYLRRDGVELVTKEYISGRPIFHATEVGVEVETDLQKLTKNEQVLRLLEKSKEKIISGDYEGAISNARSSVETAMADIYKTIVGEEYGKGGSLLDAYKRIKDLLALSENRFTNQNIKGVMSSITSMISSLDGICNEMGDRHTRPTRPARHHAELCTNIAKSLVAFLYETLNYKFDGGTGLFEQLVEILNSGGTRMLNKSELIVDRRISRLMVKLDKNIRNTLKRKFIEEYEIYSYRQSDVFFAGLWLLSESLTKKDISDIVAAQKDNNQAVGLIHFLERTKDEEPKLLNTKAKELIKNSKK